MLYLNYYVVEVKKLKIVGEESLMSQKLKRSLQSRHMSMIALGGCIGTGLFIGLGKAIADAGPGGTVIAYVLIAIMVFFLMSSLGEMAAHSPVTGTFCEYSGRYVDEALGFTTGWNYWFNWAVTVATEVIAAAVVMQYWFPASEVHPIVWSSLFFFLILGLNLFSVKIYGEVEYWLSFIKVSTVVIFIVVGTLAIFGLMGNQPVGFENWIVGDAPFHNGFWGFITVFMIAGFSFQGSELVGVTAGEAKDPSTSIPKAIRQTFWRLFVFYVVTVVIVSFLVAYNNEYVKQIDGNTLSAVFSPFTIVFSDLGFKVAATVMNVIILTAILSACNASMYTATRTLWHLGNIKQAPSFLSKINKNGTPIFALLATAIIGSLFFAVSFIGSNEILTWLINVSSLAGFTAWFTIALSHYRFRKAYVKQGFDVDKLPYKSRFFPWAPLIALGMVCIIVVGQGLSMFTQHDRSFISMLLEFLSTYVGLIVFIVMYFVYKLVKKTKIVKLEECDLGSANKV